MNRNRIVWPLAASLLLIGLGVVGRLVPHPPNVTPVAAVALFSGFYFSRRLTAVLIPVIAMLVADWHLGFYHAGVALAVYAGLTFPVLLRSLLRRRMNMFRVVGSSAASSLFFFLISNGAVWFFTTMYSSDAAGLVRCYAAGLPFLANTLVGDVVFSLLLFGVYALVRRPAPTRQPVLRAPAAATP